MIEVVLSDDDTLVVSFSGAEEVFEIHHKEGGVYISQTSGWKIELKSEIETDYITIYERKEKESD